jgi:succinoglycan biosynthesis protein ExoA
VTDLAQLGPNPPVSVVVPCRNGEQTIGATLAAVSSQDYPAINEIVIALAPSEDDTARVIGSINDPRIVVVANPSGATPAGLNAAIMATTGAVIVRVDAHALIPAGYISQAVETLRRTNAANVGGIQDATGTTPYESAVAAAMSSKFGVGNSPFHYGGTEGPTDTVYLGAFRRDVLDEVGLFDPTLIRNQDYELNNRIRDAGYQVWFDPKLKVNYRPRGSARALARQYFQYGKWKRHVLRRDPSKVRARQLAAPLLVLGLVGSIFGGLWAQPLWLVPGGYVLACFGVALLTPTAGGLGIKLRLAAAFPTMHLSWGLGFLIGRAR